MVALDCQTGDLVTDRHHFGFHTALKGGNFGLFLLKHLVEQLLLISETFLRSTQNHIAIANLNHFRILIIVLVFDLFEELLVLFHCGLLFLDSVLFRLENFQLGLFALDFSVALLVLLAELRYV